MNIKDVIHPDEIHKSNPLYRAWKFMHQNRFWYKHVPREKSICIWFWPAIFATLIFIPVIYPLIHFFRIVFKTIYYVAIVPVLAALNYSGKGVYYLFRRPINWLGERLEHRLGSHLTVGGLVVIVGGLTSALFPKVNYWYVGFVTVFALSFIAGWILLSLMAAFFRAIIQLRDSWRAMWEEGSSDNLQQDLFWVVTAVSVLVIASPFTTFLYPGLQKLVMVWFFSAMIVVAVILAIVLVILGKNKIEQIRAEKAAFHFDGGAPKAEPWTHAVLIYIRAKKKNWCPIVRFVD